MSDRPPGGFDPTGRDRTASVRSLLRHGPIVAPGVYDSLSARVVEQAGYQAAMITGAGIAATILGVPDIGLLIMTEVLGQTRNIVRAVAIPVIADCDTGYGAPLSVMRAVSEFEQAGVSALFLEDQQNPKRCGHFDGKRLADRREMEQRLVAALRARRDPEMMIIARTDALSLIGVEEAIERATGYASTGADALFVESPGSADELRLVADRLGPLGLPLMVNLVEGGLTPLLPIDELVAMGYSIISFSGSLQKTAIHAMYGFLGSLRATGSVTDYYPSRMISLSERSALLGLPAFTDMERTFDD